MKNIIRIVVTIFCLTLSAQVAPAAPVPGAPVKVVTTTPDLASLAREVGGDLVTVDALSQPNQDPHRVNATPSMVVRLSRADLFVINGLDLEIGWVPSLIQSSRSDKVRPGGTGYVDASARTPLLEIPSSPVDRSMGDVHPYGNPHYTLDPGRAKWVAWNIANGLIRVDGAHADQYKARLKSLYSRIDQALERARESLKPYRGSKVIVYHKRYEYLLDRLGLMSVAAIEPKPGVPPSASHIAGIIANHKGAGVRVILLDAWNDRRVAERIASEIGAKVVVPAAAVGCDPQATNVITLFERNVALLLEAFQSGSPHGGVSGNTVK